MKSLTSRENTVRTDLILLERELPTPMEPKLTTSNLQEKPILESRTTSRMVALRRDTISVLEVGLSSRTVHSKDGDVLMRWKSDGEESTTRTGPTAPMSVSSMLTITLISTKSLLWERKLRRKNLTSGNLEVKNADLHTVRSIHSSL